MKTGLRIPGACSKLPLADFAAWCKSAGFDSMDLGSPDSARVKAVRDAGLEVGTIDIGGTRELLSPDEATRAKGIETVTAALHAIADAGCDKAFCTFIPPDANQSRRVSFENWKLSFPAVGKVAKARGVRFALEGWPGPNYSALGVTPETLRAMFAADDSGSLGINFDPSHLIRVGVDYRRFLREFAAKVVHAHGKDTALDPEGAYLYGHLGPSLDSVIGWSGGDWRYCIPGEGFADWALICDELDRVGFDGVISVELEDFRYNGTEEGEKRGLARTRKHLVRYA